MERMSDDSALRRVRWANAQMKFLLERLSEALDGRRPFTVEDLRAIAEPLRQMEPLVLQCDRLRAAAPEWREQLEIYARNLTQMNQAFDRLRCVLLTRCSQIETQNGHLATVGRWADAWRQTL
jgi:hypothetical protein